MNLTISVLYLFLIKIINNKECYTFIKLKNKNNSNNISNNSRVYKYIFWNTVNVGRWNMISVYYQVIGHLLKQILRSAPCN